MQGPTLKVESVSSTIAIPQNLLDDIYWYDYHKYDHGPGKRYEHGTFTCTQCRKTIWERMMEAATSRMLEDMFGMLPMTYK